MSTISINTISFSRLRNAHHVGFHSKFLAEINKYEYDKLGIDDSLYSSYVSAVNVEQDIVNRSRASEMTVKMNELDMQRDKLFRKFIYQIKAICAGDPTATISSDLIASLQTNVIALYPISIADGGVQEETAKLRGLVKDMQIIFGEDLEKLGVEALITEIENVNNAYEAAFMERIREKAASSNTAEVRGNCDDKFLQITFYLNSMANVESSTPEVKVKARNCGLVVKDTNALISYYQSHYYSKPGSVEPETENTDVDVESPDTENTEN